MVVILDFPFKLISKSNEKIQNRCGRYFKSTKFCDFEEHIRSVARAKYSNFKPLECDLSFTIHANFRNKRHSDAQNLFKSVCDALENIIYVNDRQIKKAEIIIKDEAHETDCFTIFIEKMEI